VGVGRRIRELLGESVVYGISGAAAKFIAVFLVPLYTRVFTPAEYGVVELVGAALLLLEAGVVLGLDNASARWFYDTDDPADRRRTIASWLWCQAGASAAVAVPVLILARPIASLLTGSAENAILIRLAVLALPLEAFGRVLGNWLRYQRRAWTTAIFNTARSLAMVGATVLAVLVLRWGIAGIFSARLAVFAALAVAAILTLRGWASPAAASRARLREMLAFGLPLVPAAIGTWVTSAADRLILKLFCDTAEIGLYSIAASVASIMALITTAFQMAWGPFAFSIAREEEAPQVYARVLDLYALAGCFLCAAISLFAPLILRILTTEPYYPAASTVPFLTFVFLVAGGQYIAALGSSLAKQSGPIAASILIASVTSVALNFALVPALGRDGAAAGTLGAYIIGVAYLFRASRRRWPIPFRFRAAIACFGLAWAVIAVARAFVPDAGIAGLCVRGLLCLSFVPLGFALGIIPTSVLRRLRRTPTIPPCDDLPSPR